ncbi:CocE/NonD family hydrolase, partial [Cribrihabitans sp. XS_ASV171]
LVGPWGHHYPDQGHPGPALGFQQISLEWWDHWLKPGAAAPRWPRLRAWLREFDPPQDALDRRNGRWIETPTPASCTGSDVVHLCAKGLSPAAPKRAGGWPLPDDLTIGEAAGDTGYFGRSGGLPLDQRQDDAHSLTFDSEPLGQDVVLLGATIAALHLCSDAQPAQVSLRLNDVAPDGRSARVCMAVRNLALDARLDAPDARASTTSEVAIPFPAVAYRFRKGHRIRLSVASSYWPLVWPSPDTRRIELKRGSLVLPVFRGSPTDLQAPLPPALDLPEVKTHHATATNPIERFHRKADDGERISGWIQPFSELHYTETGTAFGYETRAEHRIVPGQPTSASSAFDHRARYSRPDGTAAIRCSVAARCDAHAFFVEGEFGADWENERVAEHRWTVSIPRRHS